MPISERLDDWLAVSEEVLEAARDGVLDPEGFTDERAGQALAALRAVLDLCGEADAITGLSGFELGQRTLAEQIRRRITTALGEDA